LGSIGDAYVELKDLDKAETYFKKAADKAKNEFLTPLYLKKLALVYEAKKIINQPSIFPENKD